MALKITEYLHEIPAFVDLLDRHQYSCDTNLAEQLTYRGEDHLHMLLSLRNRAEQLSLSGPSELYEDISELFSLVHQKLTRFRTLVEESLDEGDLARETTLSTVSLIHHGTPGRPSFFISRSQLEAFMELGFSNSTIARMLCISERTLQRRRAELGLPVGRSMLYSSISDEELDEIVSDIIDSSVTLLSMLISCRYITFVPVRVGFLVCIKFVLLCNT